MEGHFTQGTLPPVARDGAFQEMKLGREQIEDMRQGEPRSGMAFRLRRRLRTKTKVGREKCEQRRARRSRLKAPFSARKRASSTVQKRESRLSMSSTVAVGPCDESVAEISREPSGKWQAFLGKSSLGVFETEEEAADAQWQALQATWQTEMPQLRDAVLPQPKRGRGAGLSLGDRPEAGGGDWLSDVARSEMAAAVASSAADPTPEMLVLARTVTPDVCTGAGRDQWELRVKPGTSVYKEIVYHKNNNKWRANYGKVYVGMFPTEDQAAEARWRYMLSLQAALQAAQETTDLSAEHQGTWMDSSYAGAKSCIGGMRETSMDATATLLSTDSASPGVARVDGEGKAYLNSLVSPESHAMTASALFGENSEGCTGGASKKSSGPWQAASRGELLEYVDSEDQEGSEAPRRELLQDMEESSQRIVPRALFMSPVSSAAATPGSARQRPSAPPLLRSGGGSSASSHMPRVAGTVSPPGLASSTGEPREDRVARGLRRPQYSLDHISTEEIIMELRRRCSL